MTIDERLRCNALLSVKEVAKLTGYAVGTIYNMVERDDFPIRSIKRGTRRLFPGRAVQEYLDSI